MTTELPRPRLRRRIPYLAGALMLLALSIVRDVLLFHPRSYATELGPDGFRVHGALPDPYTGIEPMLELMKRYADAARG